MQYDKTEKRLSIPSRLIVPTAMLASLLAATTANAAGGLQASTQDDTRYAAGIDLGAFGLGVSFNVLTRLSLIEDDQIQWRSSLSGLSVEDADYDDINGIDYEDIDLSLVALKTGLDWYPYRGGWANEIFFSAGILYSDSDFHGAADTSKSFTVGDVTVNPGDIESLKTDIQYSGVLPYISVGWGSKLTPRKGWDFQAEVGLAYQLSNTRVNVRASDPDGYLSDEDISAEESGIEDDIGNLRPFATITLSYLF